MLVVSSASAFRAICPRCRSVLMLPFGVTKIFFEGQLPRPDWLAANIECACEFSDEDCDSDRLRRRHARSLSSRPFSQAIWKVIRRMPIKVFSDFLRFRRASSSILGDGPTRPDLLMPPFWRCLQDRLGKASEINAIECLQRYLRKPGDDLLKAHS